MKLLSIMLLPALIVMGTSAFAQVSSFPYSQAFGSDPLGGTDWPASKIGLTSTNWVHSTIDGNTGGCLKLTGYAGAVGEESYLDLALNTAGKTFTSGETYSYNIFRENGALGDATVVVQQNSSGSFVDIAGSSFMVQSLTATTWTTKSVTLPSSMGDLSNVKIRLKISNTGVAVFNSLRYDNASVGGGALPVELTSFTARVLENKIVELSWRTVTEVNNYGFEVERRAIDGGSPSTGSGQAWANVGFVRGAGTSTSPRDYSYADAGLAPGRYAYRIKQIDSDGTFEYSNEIEVIVKGNFAAGRQQMSNFPNPFNPTTVVNFVLPESGNVSLKVYDTAGREIALLVDGYRFAGEHTAQFDASQFASGVYFSSLQTALSVTVHKMMLVK